MKASIGIQIGRRWGIPTDVSPAPTIRRHTLTDLIVRVAAVISLLLLAAALALTTHFSARTAAAEASLRAAEERDAEERAALLFAESSLDALSERYQRLQPELKELLRRQRGQDRALADIAAENRELQEQIDALQ